MLKFLEGLHLAFLHNPTFLGYSLIDMTNALYDALPKRL